jgi:hypothetical protein
MLVFKLKGESEKLKAVALMGGWLRFKNFSKVVKSVPP